MKKAEKNSAQCRHLLQRPTEPARWRPPGVPDATAGEWPAEVVHRLAEMVVGLRMRTRPTGVEPPRVR